jgi:calcium channel MID1
MRANTAQNGNLTFQATTTWMLPRMLPRMLHALLFLLQAALVAAQTRKQLSLNALSSFNSQSLPNPPAFTLPSSDVLAVSVAVCSGNSLSSLPRFFVTNDTSVGIPGSGGGTNVFEMVLSAGLGNWTGKASNGGVLAVEDEGQTAFEVGVSNSSELFLFLFYENVLSILLGVFAS